MGLSLRTRVITRWGKKNPWVKQDGKRDFITALEAVSADGFVFPPYLIGKGSVHVFRWYKHVTARIEMHVGQCHRKGGQILRLGMTG